MGQEEVSHTTVIPNGVKERGMESRQLTPL